MNAERVCSGILRLQSSRFTVAQFSRTPMLPVFFAGAPGMGREAGAHFDPRLAEVFLRHRGIVPADRGKA